MADLVRRALRLWRAKISDIDNEPPSSDGESTKLGDRGILQNRRAQVVALLFGLPLFTFSVLALAQAGSGSSCQWKFPKWFGCVLAAHESLAGGLIGAAVVLLGAWAAWIAVQQQISSDRERAVADREEAERLLSEDLTEYAEGMAAAWRLLIALPKDADQDRAQAVFEAVAYMAERVSRPEAIATYRSMVEILGWDRRRSYSGLLRGLEELRQFIDPNTVQRDPNEVLDVIRRLADEFEYCLPDTSRYFTGLWRRSRKARSFADWVEYIGRDPNEKVTDALEKTLARRSSPSREG